jgi:hypothetical protein
VNEVCDRQQRRKQALWFAETFGLKLQTVSFADEKASIYSMNYLAEGGKKATRIYQKRKNKKSNLFFLF